MTRLMFRRLPLDSFKNGFMCTRSHALAELR